MKGLGIRDWGFDVLLVRGSALRIGRRYRVAPNIQSLIPNH
jgi:hypothetical protein